MERIIHLGQTGLTIGDLSLRLYTGATPVSAPSITLTPLPTGTDYKLGSLPDSAASASGLGYTLTFETPAGVYHAIRWGLSETQPSLIIIPIREAGHTLSSLQVKVFRNGVEYTTLNPLVELGSPGDYILSGLPTAQYGEPWSVRWAYNGVTYSISWVGSNPSAPGSKFYLEILALQAPIPIGNDSSNRAMLSFNVLARHVGPPGPFEEEICKLIQSAGLATLGTDMWFGSTWQIPQNNLGPLISVNATGGISPLQSHNGDKQTRPSAQIIVRAGTSGGVSGYVLARNKANSIHAALDGRHNINVTT